MEGIEGIEGIAGRDWGRELKRSVVRRFKAEKESIFGAVDGQVWGQILIQERWWGAFTDNNDVNASAEAKKETQ